MFAFEAHALGNLGGRYDALLDLLAGFCFARWQVLPPELIEVRNKSVTLDGCRLE